MKIALIGMFAAVGCLAADYSKKSDKDLLSLNGTLKGADAVDLQFEIIKRAQSKGDAKMTFMMDAKASFEKNTENMRVKDFREYEAGIKAGVMEKIASLSDEEREKLGVGAGGHSCPMHGGEGGGHGGHSH